MNRSARRLPLFETAGDYAAFLRVLREAAERFPVELLCYAVMPNHWHLVLRALIDGSLSTCLAWMTGTHARRWHLAHNSAGTGALYQGRFKAIAVKDDAHFLTVCRYVERNPVRARLVPEAERWRWSSAALPSHPDAPPVQAWPIPRPTDWHDQLNQTELVPELQRLRRAIVRSTPFGPEPWRDHTAQRLGWRTGMRPPGRPTRIEDGGGVAESS